ncbi:MAG: septation regulator SpoVG [Ruminococcaceae bacterium]|nr:septation regulator SpoVG [Oscillospiraceae bacterium]
MQITDVKVRKLFDEGPMKAIVSVTFDSQLAVHDIKVINARDKFFIVMPSRKNPDDTYRDIVHPINSQFRAELEDAVIEAYNEALASAPLSEDDPVATPV